MLAKIIIVLLLLVIVTSLFTGMYFMLHDRSSSTRTVKALTIRIGLSLLLFGLVILAYLAGIIQPHGVRP
jgi:hypothetical protein